MLHNADVIITQCTRRYSPIIIYYSTLYLDSLEMRKCTAPGFHLWLAWHKRISLRRTWLHKYVKLLNRGTLLRPTHTMRKKAKTMPSKTGWSSARTVSLFGLFLWNRLIYERSVSGNCTCLQEWHKLVKERLKQTLQKDPPLLWIRHMLNTNSKPLSCSHGN